MAVGKYSPTVSRWYSINPAWFRPEPYDPSDSNSRLGYDKDGYDLYGYNPQDIDRAGNHESDYLQFDEYDGGEQVFPLYDSVLDKWAGNPLPY